MSETKIRFSATRLAGGGLRVLTLSRVFDTREEAEANLKGFIEGGELPKVYSQSEIDSMRVDEVECWMNGDPVKVYLEEKPKPRRHPPMRRTERPSCCVADQNCDAPANLKSCLRPRILECYVCGEPVCRRCSRIALNYRGRRIRVCANCEDREPEAYTSTFDTRMRQDP
jgi:hypothetical protein